MTLLRRLAAALLVSFAAVRPAPAAGFRIPPIDGEFTGKFFAPSVAHLPAFDWTLTIGAAGAGRRRAELAVRAAGARLHATADLDAATGAGSWKIADSEFDAATWLAILAPQLGAAARGITAAGTVVVTGAGEIAAGQPRGRIQLVWRDGALRNAGEGWALAGISFEGAFAGEVGRAALASAGPFELTVRTVTTRRFGARNIFVRGLLNQPASVSVAAARIEIAGGEVTIDPCTIPLSPLAPEVNLRIGRIGLQDIVALVPAGLSDARGRIDGEVRASWSAAAGFQIGAGHLRLRDDEPATVRLAPAPGFLTDHVPERIALLPAWAGRLGRWLAPVNPAYAEMRRIELGQTDLRVRALAVQLTPEGDARGRSAHVQIVAAPAEAGGSVREVTFEVNVAGPLAAVLGMGMNQSFSVKAH